MEKLIYGFLVLSLFSLLFSSPLASGLQSSQNIPSLGTIIYDNVPLSLQVFRSGCGGFTEEQKNNAYLLAEKLDMYTASYYWGNVIKNIHEIRLDVKCLLYRNMRDIYNYSPEWQTALDKGWILKDTSGNLVHSTIWTSDYCVDIGNIEYQKWVANWVKGRLDEYGYDGVFSDCGFSAATSGRWYGVTAQPINPRTGNLWTSDEVIEAWISLHREIRRTIGSKSNVVNGIFEGSYFWTYQTKWMKLLSNCEVDGFMSEGLFNSGSDTGTGGTFYSEDRWKKSVDFLVWTQQNFLNQAGKVYLPHGRCAQDQIPSGCTIEQMATFVFSSLLLGIDKPQNYLSLQGAIFLDEIQNLYKIDLGVPKGNYYVIEGSHVYARDFTKIKVLVNPTDQSYSVYLDRDYKTLNGQIVSSVNIKPHTGLILKVIF